MNPADPKGILLDEERDDARRLNFKLKELEVLRADMGKQLRRFFKLARTATDATSKAKAQASHDEIKRVFSDVCELQARCKQKRQFIAELAVRRGKYPETPSPRMMAKERAQYLQAFPD